MVVWLDYSQASQAVEVVPKPDRILSFGPGVNSIGAMVALYKGKNFRIKRRSEPEKRIIPVGPHSRV